MHAIPARERHCHHFFAHFVNHFVEREGEAPAEPLRRWLGRSLALPKILTGLGIAKMLGAMASLSHFFQTITNEIATKASNQGSVA